MKIDYSRFSEAELLDALANIDKERFPDRVAQIEQQLQHFEKHFDENVRPHLTPAETFQMKADSIAIEAANSGHATVYFVIFGIAVFSIILLNETISPVYLFLFFTLLGVFVRLLSDNEDKDIFNKHKCPLCEGKLQFDKHHNYKKGHWLMTCAACKQTALLKYSGLTQGDGI